MKTSTITNTKNHLSALLNFVRHGETIIITDRDRPVARICPALNNNISCEDKLSILEKQGLVKRAETKFAKKLKEIIKIAPPKSKGKASVINALLKERAEGR